MRINDLHSEVVHPNMQHFKFSDNFTKYHGRGNVKEIRYITFAQSHFTFYTRHDSEVSELMIQRSKYLGLDDS